MKSIFNFLFSFRKNNSTAEHNTDPIQQSIKKVAPKKRKTKSKPKATKTRNQSIQEEWRPVKGYEGFYEVSSLGNIRSLDRKVRLPSGIYRPIKGQPINLSWKSSKTSNDIVVRLHKDGNANNVSVKKLVAYAFLGAEPSCQYQIKFKDNDPTNLRADNLEYKLLSGTFKKITESTELVVATNARPRRKRVNISLAEEEMILELRKVGFSYKQIAKTTNRSISTIQRVIHKNKLKSSATATKPVQLRIM